MAPNTSVAVGVAVAVVLVRVSVAVPVGVAEAVGVPVGGGGRMCAYRLGVAVGVRPAQSPKSTVIDCPAARVTITTSSVLENGSQAGLVSCTW